MGGWEGGREGGRERDRESEQRRVRENTDDKTTKSVRCTHTTSSGRHETTHSFVSNSADTASHTTTNPNTQTLA